MTDGDVITFICDEHEDMSISFELSDTGTSDDDPRVLYIEVDAADFGLHGITLDLDQAASLRDRLTAMLEQPK